MQLIGNTMVFLRKRIGSQLGRREKKKLDDRRSSRCVNLTFTSIIVIGGGGPGRGVFRNQFSDRRVLRTCTREQITTAFCLASPRLLSDAWNTSTMFVVGGDAPGAHSIPLRSNNVQLILQLFVKTGAVIKLYCALSLSHHWKKMHILSARHRLLFFPRSSFVRPKPTWTLIQTIRRSTFSSPWSITIYLPIFFLVWSLIDARRTSYIVFFANECVRRPAGPADTDVPVAGPDPLLRERRMCGPLCRSHEKWIPLPVICGNVPFCQWIDNFEWRHVVNIILDVWMVLN